MVGIYTDGAELPVLRFSRAWDEWFYIHADTVTRAADFYEELIPLEDYLFRYDRGGFWVAKYGFRRVPFTRLTRLLFSGLFKTRTLYRLLQGSNYAHLFLVQDVCLPNNKVIDFIEFADRHYNIYPLWLCPLKPAGDDLLAPTAIATDLVVNVGIWGEMVPSGSSFADRNRELEREVSMLGGRKVLYAHAYYSQEEFWRVYDLDWYKKLREKYHASRLFPDLYNKVKVHPPTVAPSKLRGLRALLASPYKK